MQQREVVPGQLAAAAVLGERLKQGKLDVLILSLPFEESGVLTERAGDGSIFF